MWLDIEICVISLVTSVHYFVKRKHLEHENYFGLEKHGFMKILDRTNPPDAILQKPDY